MTRGAESLRAAEPAGSVFYACFAAFLLLAPLYKAGNRPVPLLLLELAAIGFLFVIAAVHRAPLALPRALWAAMAVLLAYPLAQLIPLPDAVWRALPGHAAYAAVLERFAVSGGPIPWRPISIVPAATEYGWLAVLPALACLLGALRLSPAHAARLLLLLAIAAGAESLLGLLQVAPGGGGRLYLGNEEPGQNTAIGTFVNRNHFAALLGMTLPVIVGLLVYDLRPGRRRGQSARPPPASEVIARRVLLFSSGVLILLALLFTRSRAGIAAGLVGLVGSGIVLVRARAAGAGTGRSRAANYIVGALVAIAVVLALVIGIEPIRRGLAPVQLQGSADFRAAVYVATLQAGLEFFPFGSGLSTFAAVFPRFQVGDLGGYIDHAHNDYLQAFMELGLVAPVAVGLLFFVYATRMIELLRDQRGRSFTLLQLGAGLGLLPMVLHSLFDFAMHMPADAMWFAALAGVMLHGGAGARGHRGTNAHAPVRGGS